MFRPYPTLRLLALVLSTVLAVSVPVPAATVDPTLVIPVDSLIRAANSGSLAGAQRAYLRAPTIVDDFPPFFWSGGDAVSQWSHGLDAVIKQYGITQFQFTRHAVRYAHVQNDRAWIVVPTDFTFSLKGKRQKLTSAWTFVLVKASTGWRIASSTWSTTTSTLE